MPKGTCTIAGCGRPHKARSLCNMHHQRLLKHGDPGRGRPESGGCLVVGCERKRPGQPGQGQGYCARHYHRLLRSGDPADTRSLTCLDCGQVWRWKVCSGRRPQRCEPCKVEAARARSAATPPAERARRAAYKRHWAAAHRSSRRAARKAWKLANPDAVRAANLARKKRNPELNRSYSQARNARKRGLAVAVFTREQLLARLAYYGGRCWMCGDPAQVIDHVKPLAKRGAHMLSNLRPACIWCNSRKGDQWPWTAHNIRSMLARR